MLALTLLAALVGGDALRTVGGTDLRRSHAPPRGAHRNRGSLRPGTRGPCRPSARAAHVMSLSSRPTRARGDTCRCPVLRAGAMLLPARRLLWALELLDSHDGHARLSGTNDDASGIHLRGASASHVLRQLADTLDPDAT